MINVPIFRREARKATGRESLLKQKINDLEEKKIRPMVVFPSEDAYLLAKKYFKWNGRKREQLISRLELYFTKSAGKDFLVIHSPGGWGNTEWEELLEWEKSIVTGVTATLKKLGYSYSVVQYFRSGNGWLRHMRDVPNETKFFLTGTSARARVMAEEIKAILKHLPEMKIILVGASQGAAFDNMAMEALGHQERVYSIELGTFFPRIPRRKLTERTLAIDSNGIQPDPMCQRNLPAGIKSYIKAFYRWTKGQLERKPVKFTHCINTPGHEYHWEFPAVHTNITEFLTAHLGMKSKA
jgi:hypothetical protein